MTKSNQSPAPQAPAARKRRNTYRNLAIEFYARNSSSVLAITRQYWPNQPWTSQPELARILSLKLGWQVDYSRHEGTLCPEFLVGRILYPMEFANPQKSRTFVVGIGDQ